MLSHSSSIHRGARIAAAALTCALAAVGCESGAIRSAGGIAIDGAAVPLTGDEARSALLAHVDVEHSQLGLGVDAAHVPEQAPVNVDTFQDHLATLIGAAVDAQWDSGGTRYTKIGTLMSVIDPARRYIDISDSRGYTQNGAGTASAEQMTASSRELLIAMGIDPAEAELTPMPLGAQDSPTSPVERIGQKVFCLRTIGGARVAGDRMVFSYANDGSLRGIRGDWPEVDVASSQWSTTLSRDEVVGRALDALMAGDSDPSAPWPIVLETYFDHAADARGVWRMSLHISASRQGGGPDESGGRGLLYEADL